MKGKLLIEFVTLASKLYAYWDVDDDDDDDDDDDKEHKKVKGINKCIRDQVLRFNHYLDALLLNKVIRATIQRFKSGHHSITTEIWEII